MSLTQKLFDDWAHSRLGLIYEFSGDFAGSIEKLYNEAVIYSKELNLTIPLELIEAVEDQKDGE